MKQFTCWNQLLAMMFGQLSNRESLRDLIVAFEAHQAKQYHLGLGRNPIAKATLAYANQNRDYRMNRLLNNMEKMIKNIQSATGSLSYLLVDLQEKAEMLYVDYYTSICEAANDLPVGTPLLPLEEVNLNMH